MQNNIYLLSLMLFQNCMNVFLLLSTKEGFWKNVCNQAGSHWLCSIFSILWKSMATSNCLLTNILQKIFFCVQYKTESLTGL